MKRDSKENSSRTLSADIITQICSLKNNTGNDSSIWKTESRGEDNQINLKVDLTCFGNLSIVTEFIN